MCFAEASTLITSELGPQELAFSNLKYNEASCHALNCELQARVDPECNCPFKIEHHWQKRSYSCVGVCDCMC